MPNDLRRLGCFRGKGGSVMVSFVMMPRCQLLTLLSNT